MASSRSRLAGLTVAAVVVSALCVAAGLWQGQRTRDALDLERAALAAPVALLDAADVEGFPAISVGRSTYATGEYGTSQVYVGPRDRDGRSGWWVLTPLNTGGAVVAVLRGWVEQPSDAGSAIPVGEVTVSGTLQPFEEFYADRPRGPDGQLVVVSRPELESEWGSRVISLVLVLADQQPPSDPAPMLVTPTAGSGDVPFPWQNAAYTVQWFVFAVFVWVMWWMWAIRDRRDDSTTPDEQVGPDADSLAT